MAITASLVRELREMTGAAMMDCKKALEAADGNIEGAVDHLRKQGLKSAAKKASRETAEGRVFITQNADKNRAHLVSVACETDFLASTDGFKDFVGSLEAHVANEDPHTLEGDGALLSQKWQGSDKTVGEAVQEAVGQFSENIRVSALGRLENTNGQVGAYIHHDYRQGAIVAITTEARGEKVDELLRSLCQHVVVFRPSYANVEDVPAEDIERERAVIRESEDVKKRPAEYQDKIIDGKLGKFYAGSVLAEQPWIHDDKQSVIKALSSELGGEVKITGVCRIALGE